MMLVAFSEYRKQRMGDVEKSAVMLNMDRIGHILPTTMTDGDGNPFNCFLVTMEYGAEFIVDGDELSAYFETLSGSE